MDYETIKSHFTVKQQNKNSCMALCPCHNDKKASLSISYDVNSKRTLIYCHAGCHIKDILGRVGLKMNELFEEDSHKKTRQDRIEAVYKYTDEEGKLLYEKVRFKPKAFTQRRYMDGYVVWGLGAGRYYETYPGNNNYSMKERNNARTKDFPETLPVLYNLPSVIKAVSEKNTIYIVEGEKDADNLIKLGLTATTNFDGASVSSDRPKWRKEYNKYLKGADVVLLPDNDIPGKRHMINIAKELKGIAKSIKMVELPVPYKEDVTWYLNEGHSLEELLNLIRNTVYGVENIKGENFSLLNYHFSDVGNAERIIALYGSDIRYSFSLDRFLVWNSRYWCQDSTGIIFKMAKSMLRRLLAEGEALEENPEEEPANDMKKKVMSFAIRSESDSRIKAMVNQAKSQPEITLADCDTDPFLLNLSNGTLNLKTGRLREHKKSDYITRMIDIEYDKNAGCPQWMNFLHKVFLGDEPTLDFVQKSVGYSLTGSQEEQCFYMLSGTGANGKTTFLNTIKMIMGDYGDVLKASSLMARQYDDGARGDIAKLKNKRFVVSSELNEGQYFDESLIKCVTGGETVPVRFLYGEEFNLKPEFKIWMGTNEKPRIRGTDHSTWRRVRMIPFLYTFKDEERDKNFIEKYIVPELPGILKWAVEGCLKWQKEGMTVPERSAAALNEYRDDMDVVQRFINEKCITGDMYTIRVGDLYQHFSNWCLRSGDKAMSGIKFGKKLREKGFEQNKSGCCRYWNGIGVIRIRG